MTNGVYTQAAITVITGMSVYVSHWVLCTWFRYSDDDNDKMVEKPKNYATFIEGFSVAFSHCTAAQVWRSVLRLCCVCEFQTNAAYTCVKISSEGSPPKL